MLSPLLANVYLHPLDVVMRDAGYPMVRYADDFVVLCRTRAEADAALVLIRTWMSENGLTLHPDKTHGQGTVWRKDKGSRFSATASKAGAASCAPRV